MSDYRISKQYIKEKHFKIIAEKIDNAINAKVKEIALEKHEFDWMKKMLKEENYVQSFFYRGTKIVKM